jgi:RimJ/RimL family protein N-acetyltransferase
MAKTYSYILSTERLALRRWVATDVDPFVRMNQDPEVRRYFPNLATPEESIALIKTIETFFDANGYGLYALELRSTGEFVGFTGFSQPAFDAWFTPCIEIGWRLRKEFWGRGLATEAARACLDHGFQTLGLENILSFTAVLNTRSEKVMQRIGMTRLGEFDHPRVAPGHPLRPHVLYGVQSPALPK